MACFRNYKLNVKGQEFEISSPTAGGEISSLELFTAIRNLKDTDPKKYEDLLNALSEKDQKVHKPTSSRNRDIPYLIQKNLRKVGIDMKVFNEEEWIQFCENYNQDKEVKINTDAKSFVLDGIIYVRSNGFKVEDSIHELSHLLLAIMRGDDFKQYQIFIHTFFQHPEVQKIASELQSVGTYSDNYNLNFEEEAIVRYIENLFSMEYITSDQFIANGEKFDTIDFLNKGFKDIITKTFGISKYPGIITLFKSLVRDIPEHGGDMFDIYTVSTGYIEMKRKAIEAQRINTLIDYYTSDDGGNLIQKGKCL